MISHILCALVLALSLAGARDVAARQRSPEPNIAHAGPAEKAFRDSRISGPSITDLPLRFGSATEPPRASPAQNSPTSSDFDKLFQAQPMSNAAQARFQKPASASADPAASSARPSAPLRPPTASRGVREDITSSLPAAAMPAPHTRREWFAWWEKCRPRVSNRKDAGKAVEQARWRLPGGRSDIRQLTIRWRRKRPQRQILIVVANLWFHPPGSSCWLVRLATPGSVKTTSASLRDTQR